VNFNQSLHKPIVINVSLAVPLIYQGSTLTNRYAEIELPNTAQCSYELNISCLYELAECDILYLNEQIQNKVVLLKTISSTIHCK